MRILPVVIFSLTWFSSVSQNEDIREYILSHAKEIEATAPAFTNLSFLDTLLQHKRIVMLGESSHGTEEYSQYKFQLIRYLHEKLGFNVLLFESPMTAGGFVNMAKDSATAASLLRNSIQSVWHTKIVEQLFQYIKTTNLAFNGFDPQLMISAYQASLFVNEFKDHPDIQKKLVETETNAAVLLKAEDKKYSGSQKEISAAYADIVSRLNQLELSPLQQWVKQICFINVGYYLHMNKGDQRDSCMAKNIIWLAEHLYPGEKIIIWAHNTHIDKIASKPKRLMGKLLSQQFTDQLYGIGLYMINGETALNNRKIITVKKPAKGSLEEMSSATGYKASYLSTAAPIFNRKITTFHWGKDRQQMNLSRSYDAVVVINGISSPNYLP